MTAKIYHAQLAITSASATQEATGYPAVNVADPRIARPWRSTSTAANSLELDLGSDKSLEGILLQETNVGAAAVYTATAAAHPSYTSRGSLTHGYEDNGRRKAYFDFGTISARWIRIDASGTPADSGTYWRVGSVYVWDAVTTLAPAPELGWDQEFRRPSSIRNLPNGRTVVTSLGSDYSALTLRFRERRGSEYLRDLVQQTWQTAAGLMMGLSDQPELAWPVMASSEEVARGMPEVVYSDLRVELVEVV